MIEGRTNRDGEKQIIMPIEEKKVMQGRSPKENPRLGTTKTMSSPLSGHPKCFMGAQTRIIRGPNGVSVPESRIQKVPIGSSKYHKLSQGGPAGQWTPLISAPESMLLETSLDQLLLRYRNRYRYRN